MRRNTRTARKNPRAKKITIAELRKLVKEATGMSGELEDVEKVSAEEVDADSYADTLEQDLDMYKAMKIKEFRLRRKYRKMVSEARKVRKNKQIAKKRILRKLK
jgi:hypothetical protein